MERKYKLILECDNESLLEGLARQFEDFMQKSMFSEGTMSSEPKEKIIDWTSK